MSEERINRNALRDGVYEAGYLAGLAGITFAQAAELIERHGNDRSKLLKEAEKLKEAEG